MTIMDFVGNTPLITLANLSRQFAGVTIAAKAEFLNPSGSVKDRAAAAMIQAGIEQGQLTHGKTIIDATSGNTGIAYAMLGAALGYRVTLYMPANTSRERKRIIAYYGARIVETDPQEGADGAYLAVRQVVAGSPDHYFYPDQYNNPANPLAHFNHTGREIWQQSAQKVTHFIASQGTSGTFTGTARRLKQENSQIKTLAIQPTSPFHGIEGIKHMASSIKPGILDESLQDGVLTIATEEAYEMTRYLACHEGLFVGISAGANVAAAVKLASDLAPGSLLVTILCDNGSRYLSDPFWEGNNDYSI